MEKLYFKEMNARDIVDLKLVYESTKHLQDKLLKMRSILESQYVPLKEKHKLQFRLGILSKKNKAKFLGIVKSLSTINSELWRNSVLTIDSNPLCCIDITYDFNGKNVNANLDKTDSSFSFLITFIEMVNEIQFKFDLYFADNAYLPGIPDTDFSVFWGILNAYLPLLSIFLSSIDEEDLNKHFENALPVVEKSNAAKAQKDKERAEALENISNILNKNLVSFVKEKAGVNYPEDLIIEALKTNFK